MWEAIYDGTTSNDEYPYYLAAKPTGEVIVTGKGGPSPDPNNLSYLQMVILQYSNTGIQDWIDTPNIYGGWGITGLIASDNSLYAISSSNMTAYHYHPDQFTAIHKLENQKEIQVFPNPFSDKLTIIVDSIDEQSMFSIYDNVGKLLKSFKLTQKQTNFDLSEIKSGVYFCRIASMNTNQTIKVIKK